MKYTDIFCIIILIFILSIIFWNKKQENFEIYNILKSKQIDNEIIDSKFTKDQEKLLTEYYFYVNDKISTPKTIIGTPINYYTTIPNENINTTTPIINRTPRIITENVTSSLQYYYTFEPGSISNNTLMNMATNISDAVVNNATISTTMSNGFGSGCLLIDNTNLISTNTFDNRAQYIKCPNINTAYFTNGISICLWMNPATPITSNTYYIALCLGSSYSDNIYLGYTNELLFYGMNGRDSCTLLNCNPPTLNSNMWSNVVWTISPDGNHNIYLNSTSIGIPDVNGLKYKSNYSYPFYLGYNNVGIPQGLLNYYNGFLDDVRIYNRVLNSAEIQLLYTNNNVT